MAISSLKNLTFRKRILLLMKIMFKQKPRNGVFNSEIINKEIWI
jgi:hypothetical protein